MSQQQIQERVADTLSGGSLSVGVAMTVADYNAIMEAATLTVGLIAGIFAMFFHIRRWYRGRQRDREIARLMKERDITVEEIRDAIDTDGP